MSAWVHRLDPVGAVPGSRLAVKNAIDVAGLPTTAGSPAVAGTARPAQRDAVCVATARAAGAMVVGSTVLEELCYGVTGVNPHFGTPRNPLDPALVPGGSSSGSAVVVADGDADVALGTDTGGSVRIPAACCAVVGLKTTWGRVPLDGVWPLAPTLDTVGPLARDVAGVTRGMQWMHPGFTASGQVRRVGRVRRPGVDPGHEAAVDRALAAWGVDVVQVDLPGWAAAGTAFEALIAVEAYRTHRALIEAWPQRVGADKAARVLAGAAVTATQEAAARRTRTLWRAEIDRHWDRVDLLVLPTLGVAVPPVREAGRPDNGLNRLTRLFNLSGHPALSLPLGGPGRALQLVAPWSGEALLCAVGADLGF